VAEKIEGSNQDNIVMSRHNIITMAKQISPAKQLVRNETRTQSIVIACSAHSLGGGSSLNCKF
jgi:hypothetical protein